MMNIARTAPLLLVLASIMAGCAAPPPYVRPTVDTPPAFAEAPLDSQWAQARPRDDQPREPWWTVFGDPTLDTLESGIDISNQTLKKSAANLTEARALVGVDRAAWWPTVTGVASSDRTRTSDNVLGRSLAGRTVDDHAMGLSASWEPDLFGRIASRVDSAEAGAQAAAADVESVRMSLAAELATDYFSLRANEATQALLARAVSNQQAALDLARNQFQAGYASELALSEAQTRFDTTRTHLTDLGAEHARLTHALATLVGKPAAEFSIERAALSAQLPSVPVGLPSQLLERRPDIAAAERRVAAMNANIGQARAAFYPNLMIGLLGGVESSWAGSLLSAPSRFWALGPSLAVPLFDGGRRKETLKGVEARYDASVADYRQTVLAAINQVEDGLAALRVYQEESQSQRDSLASSRLTLSLAQNRYQSGAVSYIEVITSEAAALDAESASIDLQRRQLVTSVALLRALGGGWD